MLLNIKKIIKINFSTMYCMSWDWCSCCAVTLQFAQCVVTLIAATTIPKPELFDRKLCLVSQQTAVFTPYRVILITVTTIPGVCAWVGHPACALTIDRCSTPVRHPSRITWHPPSVRINSIIGSLRYGDYGLRTTAGRALSFVRSTGLSCGNIER